MNTMLLPQITRILESHDFDWCACRGCFDIAARRRELFLLKVLDNVDSVQESQAINLATLSEKLGANVSLIGTHTRYETLRDNVIYERFDIPTFTPATLDAILEERSPTIYRNRGGMFAEIDPSALKRARNAAGLTQQQLADAIGVTKKSIYEHESRKMRAQHEIADRMEKLFGEKVSIRFEPAPIASSAETRPTSQFEHSISGHLRRMGFATSFVERSPFNIIAEEKVVLISDAEPNPRIIERKAQQLEQFAGVSKKPIVVISETEPRTNLPTVTAKQLKNLGAKDLRKLAKK